MIRLTLIVLISFQCLGNLMAAAPKKPAPPNYKMKGYFWVDLVGKTTPKFALPVGKDSNGQDTFVGQIVHPEGKGSLLPGAYVASKNKVYYEYFNEQHTTDKLIRILCTHEPENYKWLKLKTGDSVEQGDKLEYVLGGQFEGNPIGIGKIVTAKNTAQGGVLILDGKFENLHYNKDKTGYNAEEFDVLYYVKK